MQCQHFYECNSCTLNSSYQDQINFKKNLIANEFREFYTGEFDVFVSKEKFYRTRAEFGIYHNSDEIYFTMRDKNKKAFKINECPKVDTRISNLMPFVIDEISKSEVLKNKLFSCEFMSSDYGLLLVLLYHKNISEFEENFKNLANVLDVNLIARSRNFKFEFKKNELLDEFILDKKIFISYGDNAFVQPNKNINLQMMTWINKNIKNPKDLLELYCGHGNFTMSLSAKFNKILATEISKKSILYALENCKLNNINNVKFLRMSSEDLIKAFNKQREFKRLKEISLDDYKFSHVLVDPPRAGLDELSLNHIVNYENIIYVSCNPKSLKENLNFLNKSHKINKFAIFDQFPHTTHIECGIILDKK